MSKEEIAEKAGTIVGTLAGAVGVLAFEAWLLMLVFGAVHGLVAAVPTVGYGTAALLTIGLNMLTSRFRRLFRH